MKLIISSDESIPWDEAMKSMLKGFAPVEGYYDNKEEEVHISLGSILLGFYPTERRLINRITRVVSHEILHHLMRGENTTELEEHYALRKMGWF